MIINFEGPVNISTELETGWVNPSKVLPVYVPIGLWDEIKKEIKQLLPDANFTVIHSSLTHLE